jgi:hypothetical protein
MTESQRLSFERAHQRAIESAKERGRKLEDDYQTNPRPCAMCNTPLPYDKRTNKYCGSSCSAKATNAQRKGTRSEESRRKTAQSVIAYNKTVNKPKSLADGDPYSPVTFNTCRMCERTFVSGRLPNKFCKVCIVEHRKITGRKAGMASAAKQIRRSKDEISLYEMCKDHFEMVSHNEPLVNGWDADIVIHDTRTAILWNGPWHRVQMPHKNHSLKQVQTRDRIKIKTLTENGWDVIVFDDDIWTPEMAFGSLVGNDGTAPSPVRYERTAPLLS